VVDGVLGIPLVLKLYEGEPGRPLSHPDVLQRPELAEDVFQITLRRPLLQVSDVHFAFRVPITPHRLVPLSGQIGEPA